MPDQVTQVQPQGNGDGGGFGSGLIIGIIVVILILVAVFFYWGMPGRNNSGTSTPAANNDTYELEVPDQIDVNVDTQ